MENELITTRFGKYYKKPNIDNIFGLKFIPSIEGIEPEGDNLDGFFSFRDPEIKRTDMSCGDHFNDETVRIFKEHFMKIQPTAKAILEIGMDWTMKNPGIVASDNRPRYERSSTYICQELKRPETIFLGVDIQDESAYHNPAKNCYFLQTSSSNIVMVEATMAALGIDGFDFIFIDAYHSVNFLINDWKYVQWLNVGGIVGLHDTGFFTGPICLFDAIDKEYFTKERCLVGPGWDGTQWEGAISFCQRIK